MYADWEILSLSSAVSRKEYKPYHYTPEHIYNMYINSSCWLRNAERWRGGEGGGGDSPALLLRVEQSHDI